MSPSDIPQWVFLVWLLTLLVVSLSGILIVTSIGGMQPAATQTAIDPDAEARRLRSRALYDAVLVAQEAVMENMRAAQEARDARRARPGAMDADFVVITPPASLPPPQSPPSI